MSEELVGLVSVEVTGVGSKSEMLSVVLHTEGTAGTPPVVLRRRDAIALSAEPELAEYAGHWVRVTGEQAWSTFVVDNIEALDSIDEGVDPPPTDPEPAGE